MPYLSLIQLLIKAFHRDIKGSQVITDRLVVDASCEKLVYQLSFRYLRDI